MQLRTCILAALIPLLFAPASLSALELDSTYLAQIRLGISLAFVDDYDGAKDVFEGFITNDSTDYAGYLFLAGVYHAKMIDAEDYSDRDTFTVLIDKSIRFAEQALKDGADTAWAELTIGNAHGYVAALEGKVGSWWTAVKQGMKAKNHWLEALRADSTLADAYLGLGNYHYWKSAKTEFINWLPFVKDRKEQGIEELDIALDSSLFSGTMACNSLVWVYLDDGRPVAALASAHELEERYPNSRMVLWALAFSSSHAGQYPQALSYFGRIITQTEQHPSNYFNLIECRFHRAKIFELLGRYESALSECDSILSYPVPEETCKRQKDKLKKARKLQEHLRKELSSN
jgi:tetratricopeptide (TPR) repeat protein